MNDFGPWLSELITAVREGYQPDSPTHDLSHLDRVASLAGRICREEGADERVVVCAAWLHDLHRDKSSFRNEFFVAPDYFDDRAREFLVRARVPGSLHDHVLGAIHYTDKYSFSDRFPRSATVEARCLRDADNLDAIGAIGVARAFSFGGSHDIPIWTRDVPFQQRAFDQSVRPSSTIHHFQEKLMRMRNEFETDTARRLAHARSDYLDDFAHRLMAEWTEDLASMPARSARSTPEKPETRSIE